MPEQENLVNMRSNSPIFPSQETADLAHLFVIEGFQRNVYPDLEGLQVIFVPDIECSHCENGEKILGTCSFSKKLISLNEKLWQIRNDDANKITMFHELGHCVLGRGHYIGKDRSIMSPTVPHSSDFIKHYDEYLDELFNPTLGLYEDLFEHEDE